MGKTHKWENLNTEHLIERSVSIGNVEVSNGIKTLVIDRVYEGESGWFLVTTITKFRTHNDHNNLTSDDEFIGNDKYYTPYTNGGKNTRWE